MSVVIRRQGYAYVWICKVPVMRDGKKVPCNHQAACATEEEAGPAYEAHKKTAKGH